MLSLTRLDGPSPSSCQREQVSGYTGAAALLRELPEADWMIADRGYDADWFRDALKDKAIKPVQG
jgi:transposase